MPTGVAIMEHREEREKKLLRNGAGKEISMSVSAGKKSI